MLPKKIIMENFGPFLHEEVDFEQMTEAPLFLISGKTGAGKTTIFDAITFALYGDASGGVRSSNEIRSSFAEPSEETRVQFLFEHQGRNYSIERWPKQTLAKKNGKGETTKNQKVQLSVFNDLGQEAEAYTKVDAVNDVIYQILHLQKDQFKQIVMLPQGEFRTFLNANSTEKEMVLRSLFGTNFYRNFTENLKIQKQDLEKAVGELTTRIDQLFQQVLSEKGLTYEESLNLANVYLAEKEQALQTEKLALSDKEQELKNSQLQFQKAQELAENFQHYRGAQQTLQQLDARLPEIEEMKKQLAREKKIQQIRPTFERVQELIKLQEQQSLEETANQQQEKALQQQIEQCQKEGAEFDQRRPEWLEKEKESQQLVSLLPLVKQREQLLQEKQMLADQLIKQKAQQTQLNEGMKRSEEQQRTLQHKISAEKKWQDRRYQELQFRQRMDQLQALANQVFQQQEEEEDQQIKLAQLVETVSRTSNRLTSETSDYKKLKSQWAAAEIARLSFELLPGEPCPVCGSKEHPAAAQHLQLGSEDLVQLQLELEAKEAQIKELETLKKQTEARFEMAKQAFDKLQSQRLATQEELEQKLQQYHQAFSDYYQSSVEAEIKELEEFLVDRQTETSKALSEIAEAEATLQQLKSETEAAEKAKVELETKLTTLQSESQTLAGRIASLIEQTEQWQLDSLQARINELTEALADYQSRLQKHQDNLKEIEQQQIRLQENQNLLKKQQQVTAEQSAAFQAQLQEQLTTAELVPADLLAPIKNLAELEEIITDFQQQRLLISDRINRLLELVQDQKEPDLSQMQNLLLEKEEQVSAFQQQYFAKENQLKQQREIIQQIQKLQQKSKKQLDELSQLLQLYQTMNGDNPQKISLERYVLQWYLAEVLQSANQQLNQLTKGRYRFELNQATGRSKGNTGLEINVYDDNAGATRSSHTLSGGESFIAALSLALGLAEVIQNQAGGVAIEALFIDEGFGSLDEEALEMAMEALEGIENAGRMIGIISHVRELKERIPQQIIVETSGTGRSSIRYQLEGWSEG
ncbi:SMC family ATPase [Enterococcus devriesei]|uniref:SMC family ATPase n=1 Tax=Enterococcus devriesei TaxID=319970 RepID=UPI0028A899C3|nr:SMC family ATPase [Enterococcus devriesei]